MSVSVVFEHLPHYNFLISLQSADVCGNNYLPIYNYRYLCPTKCCRKRWYRYPHLCISRLRVLEPGDPSLRDHEEVHGRLWRDVVERDTQLILVYNIRFDFLRYDLVEDRGPRRRYALRLSAPDLVRVGPPDGDSGPPRQVIDVSRVVLL